MAKKTHKVKECYDKGVCPDCKKPIPGNTQEGESCKNCGHVFWLEYSSEDAPSGKVKPVGM